MTANEKSSSQPQEYQSAPDLPRTFTVNGHTIEPLVSSVDLRAHLALLRSFRQLKEEVIQAERNGGVELTLTTNERWMAFLHKAVYRFQLWADRVMSNPEQMNTRPPGVIQAVEYPPLDVIMIWVVYMLVGLSGRFLGHCW
jgi:hypothetical protein